MPVMALRDLLGQPAASAFLRGVVARGRPAGAYLFQGPAGVGKGTAALGFARALLCERTPGPPAREGSGSLFDQPSAGAAPVFDDACGECSSCARAAELQHPDLKFLFPVSGEERDLEETIAETMRAVREDPYFAFVHEKAASIRLSVTRALIRELAYPPFEGGWRVVVVREADRMREDQYSALLKSIEEPGPSTVWVLTTSRPSRLPATIRSRCQSVRFASLTEALLRDVLETRVGVAPGEARVLAALAGGNLARAIGLRDSQPLRLRDEALALLQPGLRRDPAALWKSTQSFTRGRGRESLRRMIEIHQLWLRDLLRVRAGASREALVHRDRESELRLQAERLDPREIRRRLMVLEEALFSIEGNVTPDLTVFSTMSRVAGMRLGEGKWPAYPYGPWDY